MNYEDSMSEIVKDWSSPRYTCYPREVIREAVAEADNTAIDELEQAACAAIDGDSTLSKTLVLGEALKNIIKNYLNCATGETE